MAKLLVFAVLLCAVAARIGVHAVPVADCAEDQMMCNDGLSCYDFDLRCDGTRDCADGSDEAYCFDCPKTQKMCDDGLSCYNQSAICDDTWDCADGSDEADCYDFPYTTLDVNGTVTVRAQYTKHYYDGSVDLLLCSRGDCILVSVFGHYWEGSLAYSSWTGCNRLGQECTEQNSGADGYVYDLPSGEVAVQVQRRPTELAVWRLDHPENNVTVPIEAGGDYNTLMVGTVGVWDSMPVEFIYDGTTAAPTTSTAAPTTPTAAPTTPTAAPTTPTAAPTTPTAAPTTSPTSEPTTV